MTPGRQRTIILGAYARYWRHAERPRTWRRLHRQSLADRLPNSLAAEAAAACRILDADSQRLGAGYAIEAFSIPVGGLDRWRASNRHRNEKCPYPGTRAFRLTAPGVTRRGVSLSERPRDAVQQACTRFQTLRSRNRHPYALRCACPVPGSDRTACRTGFRRQGW